MALVQVGYLGRQGPTFVDDASATGKFIVLQGQVVNGAMVLIAKQPAYAENLRTSTSGSDYVFPYSQSQCALGPYTDGQVIGNAPAYTQPSSGVAFDYYLNKKSDWVAATGTTGNQTTTTGGGTTTTTGGTTTITGGGTTTTTGGGTTTTTGGDTTFSAPTVMEQISTFLSNYWWLVALIVIALLWKPVIAPALGMGKKKRSYR